MTVRELIIKHEGLKLFPYTDATGHVTVGYGHNCDAEPLPTDLFEPNGSISQATADELLDEDIDKATAGCLKLTEPWWPELNEPRQAVLIDMCFNMGTAGLGQFVHMLGCLSAGNFISAGAAMLQSKWAQQVPDRAYEDAMIVRTGRWLGE